MHHNGAFDVTFLHHCRPPSVPCLLVVHQALSDSSLALARVLVDTPQVLILDEATANIDSGTEQAIQQALAKVRQHTTLVVIAHRLSTIVEADTILVLHRGQAVERGTHQQLLAAKGRYWQMYQLQLAGEELAASAREESLSA